MQRYDFIAWDGAGNQRWYGGDHPDAVSGKYWIKLFQYGYSYLDDNASNPLSSHLKESNPTEVNGSLAPTGDDASTGFRTTTTWYDRLDRVRKVRHPDFNAYEYLYTGCACSGINTVRVIDQRGKTRDLTYDFLGRLDEAQERTPYPWSLLSKAKYSYDERDLLLKIEHFNSGSAKQERYFDYDGYGRLWKQRTPETNMLDYVYGYFANDTVQTVTDPRGISVTYSYNNRNLPTVVDYSDTTLDVNYSYGEYGERTLMQEKSGSTVVASTSYGYDTYKRLNSETRSFNGLTGTYQLGYSYNFIDALTQVTYTAGAWSKSVNYDYNYAGAAYKMGSNLVTIGGLDTTNNLMRNLNYRAFGALKAADYGNTQRIELSYHADRLNPTRMKVFKAGPVATYIVDKGYDYYNGGNNNGRLQKLTDYLDGSFTTTYNYDDYNRLSSATSGTVLTRSYSYDTWGNLTGVTAGGTANTR